MTGYEPMQEQDHAKILIVDDDEHLTFVLSAHMRALGYEVEAAHDAQTVIDCVHSFEPDVIVMDISLPGGDGISLTRTLKSDAQTQDIPIIMLTGRSGADDVVTALEAGAQEYVRKPFDVAELMARIGTVCRLRRTRTALDDLNHRLASEVDKRTGRLRVLYHFTRGLNEARSRDEIYELILDAVTKVTGSHRVSILTLDAAREHLVCSKAVGIDSSVIERIQVPLNEGVAGKVFSTGKTYVASALGRDDETKRTYESESFVSTPLVATSLMTHEERLGVLSITDKDGNTTFSADEVECVRSIADSGAIALHNQIHRERLGDSVNALLMTVGRLAEFRDNETSNHLERVSEYARILGRELQTNSQYSNVVTDQFIEDLYRAAPMHDIGKVGIPDQILCKPGKLTPEEYQIMTTHCEIGRTVLQSAMARTGPVPILERCVEIAWCHHEKYDGMGYPRGLAREEIPLSARIIALVDAYDAITSKRRYKDATEHREALAIIRADSGKHFDPALVRPFLRCAEEFDRVRCIHDDTRVPVESADA